jgi:hypothetical protein
MQRLGYMKNRRGCSAERFALALAFTLCTAPLPVDD